jgi:beta-xylosidase
MSRSPMSQAPGAASPKVSSVFNAVWMPDQGDGTYRNPVLFADYSDPDAIRVGDDYWLTASSFSHVPGLPILRSSDLVNWTLVNHALPRLHPVDHFSVPRHGGGVWAPAIRHHQGRFWIYYPDPDFGLYVTTADDPRAAWSEPKLVKAGKGLIDPCPFWDDDGTGYLIHAWAKSRSGVSNRLTLHRLTADSLSVIDEGEIVIDGDRLPDTHTVEGPKLYKRDGYYYIFAPAGGVRDGYQVVFRARAIRGPYESRIVLAQGQTAINGPHQGAWVSSPGGSDWFLHFQEMPAYGRVVHLQPMRWENQWPLLGNNHRGDEPGEPVTTHRNPATAIAVRPIAPATSDEFESSALGRQWQWQANPQLDWWSLTDAPGALRLSCVAQPASHTLWHAGHLLMQKFPAPAFVATTLVRFAATGEGARAGLIVFGHDYAWLGLRSEQGRLRLVLIRCDAAHQGGAERELHRSDLSGDSVFLRVTVQPGGHCHFAFSLDGAEYREVGDEFQARSSSWVGAKVGLFASAAERGPSKGHLDVRWFRITPANPT